MEEQQIIEQGLTFHDLFFILKKNIIIILITTFFCTFVGGIYGFCFKEVTYTATATSIVEAESAGSTEATIYQYSIALTNTFKEFIVTQPVLNLAYTKLSASYPELTKESIKDSVTITTSTTSLIMTISAASNDGQKSIDIANAMMESTIEYANTKTADGEDKFALLANKLKDVESAYEYTARRGAGLILIISFIIGILLSIAIVIVRYLLDDTYTSREAFEKKFGVNIIACLNENVEGEN